MTPVPPRLRIPTIMALGGAAVVAVGGSVYGWAGVVDGVPVLIVLVVGYFVWAGRGTDMAAVIRHQTDERQTMLRLKMQAFVGKVMSAAVVIAYVIATADRFTLWPFVVLVCLPAIALFAGWLIYGEHGAGHTNGSATGQI